LFDDVADAYNKLSPYPDAEDALRELSHFRLAILSNGSPRMLSALTAHSGLDRLLEKTISVDSKRVYKPDQRAYELVEEELGVTPDEVAFVTSNGFDACGAKNFGFTVIRIERVTPSALSEEIRAAEVIGPQTMYKAARMQNETCGERPDFIIGSLSELSALASGMANEAVNP
jgi:2-haloacid dehalogenase